MPEASLAFSSLMAFALLFGLKHGLDADHLASIDGLARLQSQRRRNRLARCAGLLFSLGHGLVMLVAACIAAKLGAGQLPAWMEPLGVWISIFFLGWIGAVNMRNALRSGGSAVALSPFTRWAMRLPLPRGFSGSLIVGALFALSFDAMSVASWFGLAGGRHGGMASTLILALCFIGGMILTDALNGFVVASLIRRSQQFVDRAGRVFSLLVAGSALLVAAFGVSKLVSGTVDAWADGKELMLGLAVCGIVMCGFWMARRMHQGAAAIARS